MMKHISKVPVRFSDLDAMGHVNNAIFLNYFEQARMDFFKHAIEDNWDWKKDGIVLARNEIDYLLPVLLQDYIQVETSVESIGNKSLTLSYEVFNDQQVGRKIFARGRSVIVCFDYHRGLAVPVPEKWRINFSTAK